MREISLWDLLDPSRCSPAAFVGAGGKSAALARAAGEARERGVGVFLSVTTRLALRQADIADRTVFLRSAGAYETVPPPASAPAPASGESVLVAEAPLPEVEKISGVPPDYICNLAAAHPGTPVFVEADGAAEAHLKVPGPQEPAVPSCSRLVAAVTGFPAFGALVSQARIHRRERLSALAGAPQRVDPALIGMLLAHREGCFKGAPAGARRIWLINQADTHSQMLQAREFAEAALAALTEVVAAGTPPAAAASRGARIEAGELRDPKIDAVVVGSLASGVLMQVSG
ncbi:MAG: selenium cofactor biosynthesis protein YqeC [Spirochaetota bacterium]